MKLLPLNTSLKEIDIYILVSQISKEVFVWKIGKNGAYQAYKRHVGLEFKITKNLFQRSEEEKKYPRMYLLDSVVAANEDAFRVCLAWMKYFSEHGFALIAGETNLRYVDDLLPETEALYEMIKDRPIDEVLSDKNLIVANYKRKSTKTGIPKNTITFKVNHKQYEQIQKKAKQNKMTMSQYCRNMSLLEANITLEAPPFSEFLAEIRGARIVLRQILYAYYKNGKYYPADIENIQKVGDKICATNEAVEQAFQQNTKDIMKKLQELLGE